MRNKVIVIVGPTASGKTKLSLNIAKKYGLEIINGDSVQVYKGLDIGSAKIKQSEQEGITHHLLDIRLPNDQYSVYNFQKEARNIMDKSDISLIVGGTGLYIKAALYDYQFKETKDESIDEDIYADKKTEELYDILLELDKDIKIDRFNRRRIIRAIKLANDNDHRSLKNNKDHLLYDSLIIYLDLDKEELNERLKTRLHNQLKEGFIEEVKSLKNDGIIANAIGYNEIYQYLDNKISFEEMFELIVTRSRQLAKKQKTFFKNQMNIHLFDATSPTLLNDVCILIDQFLGE